LYNPSTVKRVREIISEFKPDVVHAHNVHHHLSYYSLVIARKYTPRVYMTAHDAMSFHFGKFTDNQKYRSWKQFRLYKWRYNPFLKVIARRILRKNVHTIIAVSEALKRGLNGHGIGNVTVIHNGIDADAWKDPQGVESFKQTYGVGNSAILFGGRLSGTKGAGKIIEALAVVRHSVPDVRLLIVAQKEDYARRMIAHAEKLGVADRIIFTGWVAGDELRRAYYASSLVAVPSLYLDPFPTINLEAFACRKAVVATCFGGSPEIVEDGTSGYIVDPNDVEALAEKIAELLPDKEKSGRFGEAGYERVVKEFSLAQQAEEYEHLFTTSSF
jgi:glycosyltransferase involved in cell wall biosynthesis